MGPPTGGRQWYGGPVAHSRPAPGGSGTDGRRPGSVGCALVHPMVQPAGMVTPVRPSTRRPPTTTMAAMEIVRPSAAVRRPSIAPVVGGVVLGTVLVVIGVVLAWAAFATPLLGSVLPTGRPTIGQMASGIAVWAIALVAPAGCLLLGGTRLARILGTARGRAPRVSAVLQALSSLSDDVLVATGITLDDGRGVADLVVGPFGAAVIRQLPPAAVTRIREGRWFLRTRRGWMPLEDPLVRAARDAERVRRWLGHDEADFVVKTYAAVVGVGYSIERSRECAVLTPDQIPGWINALPPQRTLTDGRRDQIRDLVRTAAA